MTLHHHCPAEGALTPASRFFGEGLTRLLHRMKKELSPPPALLLGILCLMVFAAVINGMGLCFYEIVSGSMQDSIPVGSLTVVQPVDVSSLKVGDVIAYRSESIVITHRIYDIYTRNTGGRVIIAKGDNNSAPDSGWVYEGQIVGRVALSVPYLGAVLGFFSSKTWGYLIFVLLTGTFALSGAVVQRR